MPSSPSSRRRGAALDEACGDAAAATQLRPCMRSRVALECSAAKLRRVRALMRKESRQIVRDPSSIAIGVVLPVMLILLFGYGLSLDVKDVPVAVVVEHPSTEATELAAGVAAVALFSIRDCCTSMPPAEQQLMSAQVDGIVRDPVRLCPPRCGRQCDGCSWCYRHRRQPRPHHRGLRRGRGRPLGRAARRLGRPCVNAAAGPVSVQSRLWFNEANDSHYFLVPGLIVLVMTLIGAMLTAMVMAREWERGTLEALFVTPVRSDEILLGKTMPYFLLGDDRASALCAQRRVPVPRAVARLAVGAVRRLDALLLVALGIGLLISSAVKTSSSRAS